MAIDQLQLNPELSAWLATRQRALNIVKTTTAANGRILDWVPLKSQNPAGQIASPPPLDSMPVRADDSQRPLMAVKFELDDPAIERGPAGTVPIVRPDLSRLTRQVARKEFLTKKGGIRVNKGRRNRQPADPDPAGYFHAMSSEWATVYGCDCFLNVWRPTINNPAGPGDVDHSIVQVWLQNDDTHVLHSIEGGWTVDASLNGDASPHIFTYFTTNGYQQDGDYLGGYNRMYLGWIQHSPSVFPGIRILGSSTWGGQQQDVSMKFQLYREPTTGELNWWIAVQGIWMGYYPASLFNGGIANDANWVAAGGEVYSGLANPAGTLDQMGSGWQSQASWTRAAFVRNMRNQADLNGAMVNANGIPSSDTATPGAANPYNIQAFMNSSTTWASYFYVGGQTP